jgi:hypothetical protein
MQISGRFRKVALHRMRSAHNRDQINLRISRLADPKILPALHRRGQDVCTQ